MGMGALLAGLVGRTGEIEHEKLDKKHEDQKLLRDMKLKIFTTAMEHASPEDRMKMAPLVDELLQPLGKRTKGSQKSSHGSTHPVTGVVHALSALDTLGQRGQEKTASGTQESIPTVPSASTAKESIPPVPMTPGRALAAVPSMEESELQRYKKEREIESTELMKRAIEEHALKLQWDEQQHKKVQEDYQALISTPDYQNGKPEDQEMAREIFAATRGFKLPDNLGKPTITPGNPIPGEKVPTPFGPKPEGTFWKAVERGGVAIGYVESGPGTAKPGSSTLKPTGDLGQRMEALDILNNPESNPAQKKAAQAVLDEQDAKLRKGKAEADKAVREQSDLSGPVIFERPEPKTGNKVEPTTGLTFNAIYQYGKENALTGRMPSIGLGSTGKAGNRRDAIMNSAAAQAAAAGVDLPTLQAEYKANEKALGLLVPRYNISSAAAMAAIDNLDLSLGQSRTVSRTDSAWVNSIIQKYQSNFTEAKELSRFETYIYTAAREYAKVVSGGAASAQGLTDTASREAERLLNVAKTPGGLESSIEAMKKDMENVIDRQLGQINSISSTISSFFSEGKSIRFPKPEGRLPRVPGTEVRPSQSGVNDKAKEILKGIGIH